MFLLLYTEDAFADVTEENYFRIKDQIVEETIDYFEQAAKVSIRDHIEELVTASPVTLARYIGTPQGNCYGYAVPMWDLAMLAPYHVRRKGRLYRKGIEILRRPRNTDGWVQPGLFKRKRSCPLYT